MKRTLNFSMYFQNDSTYVVFELIFCHLFCFDEFIEILAKFTYVKNCFKLSTVN